MKPKTFRFEKQTSWEDVALFYVSLEEMQERKCREQVNQKIDRIIAKTDGENPNGRVNWIAENGEPLFTAQLGWSVYIKKGIYVLHHEVLKGYDLVEFYDEVD